VQRGDLVVVSEQRPMVLSVPPSGDGLGVVLSELHRSFWETPPGEPLEQSTEPGEGFEAL
jgi:hypothetical protein